MVPSTESSAPARIVPPSSAAPSAGLGLEASLSVALPADARVVHILGEPSQTRHLLVADGEAVVSPSWSVHCGVGTAAYTFVWAMAGENQSFDDMDGCAITDLR